MPQPADHVQQHGKHNAQNDGRGQRKVKGSPLATVKNISGQASEGKARAPEEEEEPSQYEQDDAEEDQELPNLAHDISLN
jgi:hypothetical protein